MFPLKEFERVLYSGVLDGAVERMLRMQMNRLASWRGLASREVALTACLSRRG